MKFSRILAASISLVLPAAAEVSWESLQSLEEPRLDVANSTMTVGLDGRVYLTGTSGMPTWLLTMNPDGSDRRSGEVIYALANATANADGVVATANGHFSRSVNIYSQDLNHQVANNDFLNGDGLTLPGIEKPFNNWYNPRRVEAAPSGDFYALDGNRLRVVRLDPNAKVREVYPLPEGYIYHDLRIDEARSVLYVTEVNELFAIGFDGQLKWSTKVPRYMTWTLDGDGQILFVSHPAHSRITVISPDGEELETRTLNLGEHAPSPAVPCIGLDWHDGKIFLKRRSPTELFLVVDDATGELLHVENSRHRRMALQVETDQWVAGSSLAGRLSFEAEQDFLRDPAWKMWATPLGDTHWKELRWDGETISVPEDFAGLYQMRVSNGLEPQAGTPLKIDGLVDVQIPDAQGTVSVWTPYNRVGFARGEAVPLTVSLRSDSVSNTQVRLMLDGPQGLSQELTSLTLSASTTSTYTVQTDLLPSGRYRIRPEAEGLTGAGQGLEIGPDSPGRPEFLTTFYADYRNNNSLAGLWDFADEAEWMRQRALAGGWNNFVNRTFAGRYPLQFFGATLQEINALKDKISKAPSGTDPHKMNFGFAQYHTLGQYSGYGINELLLFINMDAGLPLGNGFDSRTDEQFTKDVQTYTQALDPVSSFAGWTWVANWWTHGPELQKLETEEYKAALKTAMETGAWSPILDEVGDQKLNWQVEAQELLGNALDAVSTGLVTASSGPYRRPEIYPPVNFSNVDEVDLHFQAEQITAPDWTSHAVDYYKRPGKPAWLHPEYFNEAGEGQHVGSLTWLGMMRGTTGIGMSGPFRTGAQDPQRDARSGYYGMESFMAAINHWALRYGPWLNTLENRDRIGIAVSKRQVKVESWSRGGGAVGTRYFSRLYEAYQSFMYSGRPATFLYPGEVTQAQLERLDALVLVSQEFEPEPELEELIERARLAGVRILLDETSRKELLPDAELLPIAFDRMDRQHYMNNDYAYWEYPEIVMAHARVLNQALAGISAPVLQCTHPEVLISQRGVGDLTTYWVVNNAHQSLDPGLLWRVTPAISVRIPVQATVEIPVGPGQTLYEVFQQKELLSRPVPRLQDRFRKSEALTTVTQRVDLALSGGEARLFAVFPTEKGLPAALIGNAGFSEIRFDGPRLRDAAVSADGTRALINSFNWDRNIHVLDLETGRLQASARVGHYYGFEPLALGNDFLVRGVDLLSAEGYQDYLVNEAALPRARFSYPGVLNRMKSWAFPMYLQSPDASHAAAANGSWLATAGNIGVSVWTPDGKRLWVLAPEDASERQAYRLLTLGDNTLVVMQGGILTAYPVDPSQGSLDQPPAATWTLTLPENGTVISAVSAGELILVNSDAQGGRCILIQQGSIRTLIPIQADAMALSPDGKWIAATQGSDLHVFDDAGAPLWSSQLDSEAYFPEFSPDSRQLAVSSSWGTCSVFNLSVNGTIAEEAPLSLRLSSVGRPVWLPNGDLLVAEWMGRVTRFDPRGKIQWSVHLGDTPAASYAGGSRPEPEALTTHRWRGWINASDTPRAITNNLMNAKASLVTAKVGVGSADYAGLDKFRAIGIQNPAAMLFDGDSAPPEKPWIPWHKIDMIDSGWNWKFAFEWDTFREQIRVEAITFVEDPAYPESWIRDARLEVWDAEASSWKLIQIITSDSAVHTHELATPVDGSRFRLVSSEERSTGWPQGNIRLAEIVLHGTALGNSHPDVVAKRPVAVLFDEDEAALPISLSRELDEFAKGGAYSGGTYLRTKNPTGTGVPWLPAFGHQIPNWDFEIVENPQPGQYRYLQFAVRTVDGPVDIAALRVGSGWANPGIQILIGPGDPNVVKGVSNIRPKVLESVPEEWTVVTVDLWAQIAEQHQAFKDKFRIRDIRFHSSGEGSTGFDQIRLGRSLEDLNKTDHN